ncbi:MAG TPA: TonB-dependent receptor [Chitinophagaceae bacterium]|nr:TonB-dependent receptor [Chitinophagaceae bacterium]MBP7108166.1 TonB-dependent receptor [Chitinophagaceae bacterium]MBP7314786.1 TonB-dependent receptor [Chitinophagaceae bacterium]HQV55763.1 TonB-dependent receptor [Chitinophagaceae bacterium]
MSNKYVLALAGMLCIALCGYTQEDTTFKKTLGEIVISVNKWEQKLNEVPNKIVKINKLDILRNNPQTSADLLSQTGAVFVQKSQLGGGSPMIRGFATNRVLLVVDGVRMNNAIYRSGNLQNVISIDALSTETAEVIFGPGSLIYGSDAIGGVMDFHTLDARFSKDKKMQVRGSVLSRYSTANKENTIHADINLGWKKWSVLSSFSFSKFDDLKMGGNGGQDSYLRPEYVERVNNTDNIVQNSNPRIQRFSGYDQTNFLQKICFKPNENWDLQYSFTYAKTGDAPRYDRLIQYRNGALRFAEWYYGPMKWNMHNLQILHSKKTNIYDDARLTVAYQDYEESRIDRTRNNNNRNRQVELVDAINANWDATKSVGKGEIFYGLEYVHNKVGSFGERINISTNVVTPMISRYPNGSTWNTAGVYGSYKVNLHPKVTLTTGLRYSYNTLNATFDTTFIKFPFMNAEIKDGALTGNAGLVFRPAEGWQLNGNVSTGYRMPNVDDIGKLFESVPGNVSVPNPDLIPEYAWNFELGIIKNIPNKFRIELNAFHTILDNAIVRRFSTFNGQDSILFNGILSQVEALQNVGKATVSGFQISSEFFLTRALSLQTHANWITGKETDDTKNEQVPLRHAPPFYGSTTLRYKIEKLFIEASAQYNSKIENEDLAPSEQAKTDIYAKDANGKPYSPGWYTLGLKASYQIVKNLQVTVGWENITNQRYRSYSSGIVAAGSNFIVSLRTSF